MSKKLHTEPPRPDTSAASTENSDTKPSRDGFPTLTEARRDLKALDQEIRRLTLRRGGGKGLYVYD